MANPQLPIGQTEDDDDNVFFDLLAAPFRGIEGAVQGAYNLVDFVTFDILPDYDEKFLGKSTTVAGSAVEGISQFMTGFIPIFGWAGRAGTLAKAGSLTQKALSGTVSRGAIAGAVTDFTMFNGQEARLSNFIQQYPELQNPVTEYLAHDEDEGEIEGRIKNVLEGLGLEFAALGFIKGLKSMKRGKKKRAEGGSPKDVALAMQEEFGEEGVKLLPDFGRPVEADAPTQPKVTGFKTQGDPKEVGDLPNDIDFLRAGGKITVMTPDEYIDMAVKAFPNQTRKEVVYERLADVEGMERNREAIKEDLARPLMIDTMPDGTVAQEGLHRALAAKELGLDEVPVIVNALKFLRRDLPDLTDDVSARMKEVEAPVSTLDEAIDARPPRKPFKTNLEAGRGLEGSRGAQYIKNRLQKKFTVKGADPDEVKDVETFIDTIGEDMFSDVSLSITSKITSKGRFNFANKLLEIRRSVVEGGSLSRTMVHELWHSLSRYLPKKDVDALLKQFNRERNKYIQSFGVVVKDVDKWDLQNIKLADQPQELKDFLNGKYNSKNYRFSEIDEYFAEEMTDAFLAKLDADAKLAPQGTFKRAAQDIAILLKHLFASVKSKLGIDQRQKIFNDFIKQRNVKKQRLGALDTTFLSKEMKDFAEEVPPQYAGVAKAIARGETITLPRFETTDQQHSFIEALRKEVASDRTTMERMKEEAEAGLPADFGDNTITDRFRNMEQTVENQRQVRLEATIYKKVGAGLVKKLHDIAKEYRDSGGGDLVTAKLKNTFQEVVAFSEQYFRLGRETSLALGGRRQRLGRRKLGLSESEMKSQGIRKNFVNENGGMSVEKIVTAIEEGVDPKDFEASINGLFKLARKSQGRKLLDMPTEYWINSILSGPRTQVVNVVGNALTTVLSTLETAIGGVLTGNLEVTRQAFAAWADMSMYKEAASFAKQAMKIGENLLDPDARAFNEGRTDAITPEAFGRAEGERGYKLIKGAGNFLRLPSRLLMTTDEFFKQLNYRRAARFKLAMDGVQQGINDPRQLAEYIEKGLEDVITAGGRHYSEESLIREGTKAAKDQGITDSAEEAKFVEQYVLENKKEGASALADFALEEARYLTFTKDLERGTLGAALQGATQAWSPLRFVLPFVRTPTNILAFAFERTPLSLIPSKLSDVGLKSDARVPFPFLNAEREKMFEALRGTDPIARAQAMGKLSTSVLLSAVFLDTIVNNREYITGGGPKDENEKKALRATGWQPYSFKIDGKYYSYQRLDPIGTILGVGADLIDQGLRAPRDFDQSGLDKVFSALTLTFVRNVTNKSYLSGIQMFTDAMSDPERYGDRLLRNFGSSMLPYSGFLSQIQYGTGTQEAREVRSFADAFLNKLPSGRDNLDPKRNILGEAVMIENKPIIGAISPIAMSTEKNDPILTELANLNHAFRSQPSTYGGLIDLLAFENDKGRTAHDRRQEKLQTVRIGGRTLRQALQKLISSRSYQSLPAQSEPGLPSPRVQKITTLLTKYRAKAFNETLTEFPELSRYYEQVSRAKTEYRQGADHSSVLSLLNQ